MPGSGMLRERSDARPGAGRAISGERGQLLSRRRDPLAARPFERVLGRDDQAQDCVQPVQAAVRVRRAAPPLGDQQTAQRDQAARCLDQIAVCGLLAERAIERGEGGIEVASFERPVIGCYLSCGCLHPLAIALLTAAERSGNGRAGASPTRCRRAGPDGAAERPRQHRDGARFAKTDGAAGLRCHVIARSREAARLPPAI